jgi:hypothetical protein
MGLLSKLERIRGKPGCAPEFRHRYASASFLLPGKRVREDKDAEDHVLSLVWVSTATATSWDHRGDRFSCRDLSPVSTAPCFLPSGTLPPGGGFAIQFFGHIEALNRTNLVR